MKSLLKTLPPIKRLLDEREELHNLRAKFSDSDYDDHSAIDRGVEKGDHRDIIGGLWDEVGRLQFRFLVEQGLRPEHTLLDIGCGPLRGGVHYIPYLESGNYWGVDISASLLEAGWNIELKASNLQERQPRDQLVCLADFEFADLAQTYDFAVAVSLFTHLNFNRIRRCLTFLAPVMKPGGKFFATVFEAPLEHDVEMPLVHNPGDVVTHSNRDPFHYRISDMEYAGSESGWMVHYHGDWNHPRDQKMVVFVRQ